MFVIKFMSGVGKNTELIASASDGECEEMANPLVDRNEPMDVLEFDRCLSTTVATCYMSQNN